MAAFGHRTLPLFRFSIHSGLPRRSLRFTSSSSNSAASEPANAQKQKPLSPHIGFYKSFGRPIAKVFLGAILTYQTFYLIWMKLEKDEERENKEEEIKGLEGRLKESQGKQQD